MTTIRDLVREHITDVPDFPMEGIVFKDITTLLSDAAAFRAVIDHLAVRYRDYRLDQIAAIESRGFIFGAPLAERLGCGLTLIRKPGKLPRATISRTYALEYGEDALEMHQDALKAGDRVLLLDDLLATGGTCEAAALMLESAEAELLECAFVLELGFLDGRNALNGRSVYSIVQY